MPFTSSLFGTFVLATSSKFIIGFTVSSNLIQPFGHHSQSVPPSFLTLTCLHLTPYVLLLPSHGFLTSFLQRASLKLAQCNYKEIKKIYNYYLQVLKSILCASKSNFTLIDLMSYRIEVLARFQYAC